MVDFFRFSTLLLQKAVKLIKNMEKIGIYTMNKYQKYTLFTLSLENSFEFGFNYIYLESRIVPGACACACACVFHNSFNSHA